VEREAKRLGLNMSYDPKWEKRGFITLIRNNWYVLPYSQLQTLLGYDEEKLDFILANEDFLSVKLGNFKPECEEVQFTPLTEEEVALTERLAKEIKARLPQSTNAFKFFSKKEKERGQVCVHGEGIRLLHGYLTPCGDPFMQDGEEYLPDELLQEYQRVGVNGVWAHGLLSTLCPYPFQDKQDEGWKLRRKNLQTLVDRAAKYGVKVYLYFNEPRGIPENALGKYAYIKGATRDGMAHLCLEKEEVRDYLYGAVKDLFSSIKGLGGAITITMSENPTHCNSHIGCNCPICKDISPEKSAATANNLIARGIRDSGSGAKTVAYLWGWSPFMEWSPEQTERGISYLDEDVIAVCASEYGLPLEKGGVKSEVIDYSISNPGPSPLTKLSFAAAQKKGMRTCAKIQANNSWECSGVPYLPTFELVLEHLQNLNEIGVRDYMLTWTLGGYPSPVLDLVAEYADDPDAFSLKGWYEKQFSEDADTVRKASEAFCEGFREYPFSIQSLYFSPKTLAVANLWSLRPEGKESTMVCFAFDDYETWIDPYPYEVYISQMQKLLSSWAKGVKILQRKGVGMRSTELLAYAEAAYIHFKADLLQTEFSYLKRSLEGNKERITEILYEEKMLAEQLLVLFAKYPAIGFEASNHYYYNERNLTEKILQTDILIKNITEDFEK